MRLHTNTIHMHDIIDALLAEREAGRIASHVGFKTLTAHRSQSHSYAYEVQLEASERDNGRRAGNSGSYGAMVPEHDGYAATYDEWGWLIAALYKLDPDAVWGSVRSPQYRNRGDFNHRTGLSYSPSALLELIDKGDGEGDPYPYVSGRSSGFIGRRGAGRILTEDGLDHERRGWPVKYAPRTAEQVREFAHLLPPLPVVTRPDGTPYTAGNRKWAVLPKPEGQPGAAWRACHQFGGYEEFDSPEGAGRFVQKHIESYGDSWQEGHEPTDIHTVTR